MLVVPIHVPDRHGNGVSLVHECENDVMTRSCKERVTERERFVGGEILDASYVQIICGRELTWISGRFNGVVI